MQPEFEDRTLICGECRERFVFTSEAQSAYLERGLPLKPRLCPDCYTAYRKLLRVVRDFSRDVSRTGQHWQGRLI
ncbi:MAG: hypothetical protein GY867_00725 [bacterium]|nr:hypothetical protein [bacterium]